MEKDFKAKGIDCFNFSIRTKNEFHPKLFFALFPIARLVKKEKFDVLHAHTRVTQVSAFFISKITGVPFVSTAHGFYKTRFSRKIFGCWGKRVAAISPLVAESLRTDHGVDPKKIRMIQNAVDSDQLKKRLLEKNTRALREKYGIPEKSVVIGSIGRLVKDKGHKFLVEAAAGLKKENFNIFLLILGDGREKERLLNGIETRGLQDRARIIPAEKDMTEVLSVIDIFVHPATHREGFGLSIAEAMIAKKPVIATDIPAINTLIRNNETGFMVEPSNAEALKAAIRFLIQNPETAKTVAEKGCRMVTELCSMDRMANELEALYKEVAGNG